MNLSDARKRIAAAIDEIERTPGALAGREQRAIASAIEQLEAIARPSATELAALRLDPEKRKILETLGQSPESAALYQRRLDQRDRVATMTMRLDEERAASVLGIPVDQVRGRLSAK